VTERASVQRECCDIAVVGIAGRFPGASDAGQFWSNLCSGVESISTFEDAQLEDAFDRATRAQANFVRSRSVLADADRFDAAFFGIQAREAELIDPQHRVFLECCWTALEDAGYDPGAYAGTIGVLAGCSINTYFLRHVLRGGPDADRFTSDYQVGSYPELLGAGHDFLATRVAYKLNLRGPAVTLQSACSTSLAAIAQACQNLLLGQADMMLAGAVSITFPQQRGYVYEAGGMVSADGHCRTFDAAADGTVFGSGAGVVVLKRVADAVADGDTIYARIRGFGITNDGAAKIGYTAPSVSGQVAAITAAHAMAGIRPAQIGFVECHGTATPLGDPIEFAALAQVFGDAAPGVKSCALGSVKTNVGHLDVAAGMTSLIKTILALRTGQIPPTLHFTAPNPRIDLERSPFFVNTELMAWPHGEERYAGVSAFGLGGTNVHLVLAAQPPPSVPAAEDPAPQLIVVSARTPAALAAARERLGAYFAESSPADFARAAFTLQTGRRAFPLRHAFVAQTPADAARQLASDIDPVRAQSAGTGGIAFMFPGQGAQYPAMGRELYARLPVFRDVIDRCADVVFPLIGADLRVLMHADGAGGDALMATEIAQPAIFAIDYALAAVWRSWGITPTAMIGHSVGEFVAACLAGVMSLEDALACVAERGRLMRDLPGGAMLAVRLPLTELEPLLTGLVEIAAVNSPQQCVVAGPNAAIAAFEAQLTQRGVPARRLATSHAFHSAMVEPILGPLAARIARCSLAEPTIPYVSSLTGDWITPAQATSAAYWAQHCRERVRFADGVDALISAGLTTLLEVGPGSALATCARQCAARDGDHIIASSLPTAAREGGDLATMLAALGHLWVAGGDPDWRAITPVEARYRVPLPTYPFERKRHWIEAHPGRATTAHAELGVPPRMETRPPHLPPVTPATPVSASAEKSRLEGEISALLAELSGEEIGAQHRTATFLALGFDSLALGRFAGQVQSRLGVSITFRQLLGDLPSIAALADHICAVRPQPVERPAALVTSAQATPSAPLPAVELDAAARLDSLMRDQLAVMQQLMRDQLAALGAAANTQPSVTAAVSAPVSPVVAAEPSRFEVFRPGASASAADELTRSQRAHIAQLVARTTARTAGSKVRTQATRSVLADPRVAAGFRSEWKEMVYPITCVRAKGSRLWDVDGNEYIDLLNGFGQTAFGHAPDFVVAAVTAQLERGFAIGPQTDLAGEVAELFCELTGNERVTFCNTGSEAVMAALRIARTVTGRDRVALFNGAYHGQFDEVLVKGARTSHRAIPVAPGIPTAAVSNMTVLPYATPESLQWIREHAGELAAVVVEPVQSRHPALQPRAFLEELRAITSAAGTALVFDEVVTGFRIDPGGMQAVFGIRADLATYGKVVGGGMPVGILAGSRRFMDALDGGMWQYGDDSIPEVAPTFFAGTFVRHPLVMAAVLAVLKHLKATGPELQRALTERTAGLVARLNAELAAHGVVSRIETFGSLFYMNFAHEEPLASLLYYHLRNRGVYVQEGFPCFLTTEHSAADIDVIVGAFADSLTELASAGIFAARPAHDRSSQSAPAQPATIALTEAQTEIWLAAQLGDEASCSFNESVRLRLTGELDEAAFGAAWNAVLARHDALRTTFSLTGETMSVAPRLDLAYARVHLDSHPAAEANAEIRAATDRDARTPFDLITGPPIRGTLFHISSGEHVFVLTAHHIICDGWSMNVILDEFAQLYAAHTQGRAANLPPALSFRTYARRERERDVSQLARVESFWLDAFNEPVRPLDVPTDRPRSAQKTFNGATRSRHIDAQRAKRLRQAGAQHGCTLFVTLLTGLGTLLARLADHADIVIGVPAAGQALLAQEILVGHCVDFLPIRLRTPADAPVSDVLAAVKRTVLDAYEHQSYTLGTLVRRLEPQRASNRLPLTEVQFNLERFADDFTLPGVHVTVEPNPKAFVNFDLFFNVIESAAGLRIDCDYNTDLFDAATIDRQLAAYETVLDALAADAATPVRHIAILPSAERQAVLYDFNATDGDVFGAATIPELFAPHVRARPDAIAVRSADATLTYAQLDRRANRLAQYLRSGAVAAETATLDPRVRAAVNLDGWMFGEAADRGVPRPFMLVSDAAGAPNPNHASRDETRYAAMLDDSNLKAILAGLARYGGYYLTISGTDHENFADVAVLPSLRHTGVGPIDGRRAEAIVATYVEEFFDHCLNGRAAPLLESTAGKAQPAGSRHGIDPAARLEIWHPASAVAARAGARRRSRSRGAA
jgi:acyl transferase domain-containing protein